MSERNVQAAIEALETVIEDVRNEIGQETAAQKIAFIGYEGRTRALIESLGFLFEGFFSQSEETPEETPEEENPREG